jgi:phosphoglycerate dehydrogenase-like enzyme
MNIVAITGMNISYLQENIPDEVRGEVEMFWCKNTKEADELLEGAEVLVTSGRLHPSIPERTPKLRWVQSLSSGVDKLPLKDLAQRNIILTNARSIHAVQMSEFALSSMLDWVRNTNKFRGMQRQKIWDSNIPVAELHGKTIGIIGTGAIGQEIARKCQVFDMKVIGFNRNGSLPAHFDEVVSGREGLHTLLQISDFVVLVLPSTAKTHHFITREHLQLMKRSAFLINLARGHIIQEEALIAALQEGTIAGAALDVFDQEPLPDSSPFWTMENVLLTPHIAGVSEHYLTRVAPIFYHNLKQYLAGKSLMNLVDLQEGY